MHLLRSIANCSKSMQYSRKEEYQSRCTSVPSESRYILAESFFLMNVPDGWSYWLALYCFGTSIYCPPVCVNFCSICAWKDGWSYWLALYCFGTSIYCPPVCVNFCSICAWKYPGHLFWIDLPNRFLRFSFPFLSTVVFCARFCSFFAFLGSVTKISPRLRRSKMVYILSNCEVPVNSIDTTKLLMSRLQFSISI